MPNTNAVVPVCIVNRITVYSICDGMKCIDPNDELDYADVAPLQDWMDAHDAIYYARPKEAFELWDAALLAEVTGKSAVVVENLS